MKKIIGILSILSVSAIWATAGVASTVSYKYDALGRLIEVDYGVDNKKVTYAYDAAGNRISHVVTGDGLTSAPFTGGVVVLPISGFIVLPLPGSVVGN